VCNIYSVIITGTHRNFSREGQVLGDMASVGSGAEPWSPLWGPEAQPVDLFLKNC